MIKHIVRFILVDGDETTFELGADGSVPETFTTVRGVTYPCPQTGAGSAAASLWGIIGRLWRDVQFGVPEVSTCFAEPGLIEATVKHDAWRALNSGFGFSVSCFGDLTFRELPPYGTNFARVQFFNLDGAPINNSPKKASLP